MQSNIRSTTAFLQSPNSFHNFINRCHQHNKLTSRCACIRPTPTPIPATAPRASVAPDTPQNNHGSDSETSPTDPTTKPIKRRRGRPKGSKNRKPALDPDARPSNEPTDWSDASLRAPNGLPENGPEDLLQELVPILAKEELKRFQKPTEHEEAVRQLLRETMDRVSSNHRSSGRLDNLRPFSSRPEPMTCDACDGLGMTSCDYCQGEGFVDFGEKAHRFYEEFKDEQMVLPKHVMGNTYHCPFCGGLQKERCVKCLGIGELVDTEAERVPGAAASAFKDDMWREFDLDDMLKAEGDPDVQMGQDGLMIVRAKSKKGRPRKSQKQANIKTSAAPPPDDKPGKKAGVEEGGRTEGKVKAVVKRRRGRPRKKKVSDALGDADAPSQDDDASQQVKGKNVRIATKRVVGPSTDFLNITDYQVGRKLREQGIIPSSRRSGANDDADSLSGNDGPTASD